MTTIIKPPLVPESISMHLERSTRIVRSAEGGAFQREVREGQDRWIADITWPPLHGDDRRELDVFLEQAGRGDFWALIEWPFNIQGSFPSNNLLSNPDFTNGISSWQAPQSGVALLENARRAKAIVSSGVANPRIRQNIDIVNGERYVLQASFFSRQPETGDVSLRLFDTNGAGGFIADRRYSSPGRMLARADAVTTDSHEFSVAWIRTTTDEEHFMIDDCSLVRCPTVLGSFSAGKSKIAVTSLPTDTHGLLKAGDFVEIVTTDVTGQTGGGEKTELKRLTSDVDSGDWAGLDIAYLYFEPALRNALSGGEPVIIHRPRFKAVMSRENQQTRYTQPDYVQVTRRFEEDILA